MSSSLQATPPSGCKGKGQGLGHSCLRRAGTSLEGGASSPDSSKLHSGLESVAAQRPQTDPEFAVLVQQSEGKVTSPAGSHSACNPSWGVGTGASWLPGYPGKQIIRSSKGHCFKETDSDIKGHCILFCLPPSQVVNTCAQ